MHNVVFITADGEGRLSLWLVFGGDGGGVRVRVRVRVIRVKGYNP